MKYIKILTISIILLFFSAVKLFAFDINFWRHPEIAEKDSIFVEAGIPVILHEPEIIFLPLDIRIDYMLPLFFPLSAGAFFQTPYPNFKSFGLRLGYHIDINSPQTDLYFVYSFNFGFLLSEPLIYHNDTPPPVYFYDFRLGVRHFFDTRFGLVIETGHKLESILILLSIKLN